MTDQLGFRTVGDTRSVLQEMLVISARLDDFLDGLVEVAAAVLPEDHSGVLTSVTLLRPRSKAAIASSSPTARRLAAVQHRFGDGPSLQAAQTGRTVGVTDLAVDMNFPLYRSVALQKGIRSALGIPVPLDGPERAAVTYYSSRPSAFSQEEVASAELFAQSASTPVQLALRLARLTDRAEQLAAAMESRTTIDLAAGVIMAQNRCTQDEAIGILRTASSSRNMKLRDLAASVLTTTANAPVSTHFD